jgi:hypothetical protein
MKKLFFLIPACILAFISCKKTPDTNELSANFAVQTSKDLEADFSNYKTYYISDTISLRTTNPNDSLWFDNDAKQLINAVKENMSARGYTFVNRFASPELGLALTAVKDLNVGVVYPGWWYGGYWGYWGGCYWGYCGYPPYYGYGAVYTIPTGTIVLDMIDVKNAKSTGKLKVIWGSVMSGGLGYTSNDLQLGVEAINQSFEQSSYIQTK